MTNRKVNMKIRFLKHKRDHALQFLTSLQGKNCTDYEVGRAEGQYQAFVIAFDVVKDLVE